MADRTTSRDWLTRKAVRVTLAADILADPDIRAFLSHGTRTGKLGWTAADGRPLVAPIWFLVEDDTLVFNTGASTAKGRAFARDQRRQMNPLKAHNLRCSISTSRVSGSPRTTPQSAARRSRLRKVFGCTCSAAAASAMSPPWSK